jgi:hypothetical protein
VLPSALLDVDTAGALFLFPCSGFVFVGPFQVVGEAALQGLEARFRALRNAAG